MALGRLIAIEAVDKLEASCDERNPTPHQTKMIKVAQDDLKK